MSHWKNKDLLLGILVLASTGTVAVAASVIGVPQPPCAGARSATRAFTIIGDLDGYNESRRQDGAGPSLTVQDCDTVVINFANRDVQAHGLAVDFYAVNGLEVLGGDSAKVQFLAYKPGDFRVFCNIVCSIHSSMQHATLMVKCAPGPGCV